MGDNGHGRKVAEYLSELIGQPISRQQGWEYLKQMRMRLRVPRPQHQEADSDQQEAWKKKLQEEVKKIQVEHPDADVQVWSEDEHRVGLHPLFATHLGGTRRTTYRHSQLEAGMVMAVCVCTASDRTDVLVDFEAESPDRVLWQAFPRPYVNTELFSCVLKDFAEHFGVGQNKRIVLPVLSSWMAYQRPVESARGHPLSSAATVFTRITTG